MSSSSRKGKKIARRACDLCRDRKVQCIFDVENGQTCQKCLQFSVPCTFLSERRPRGPPNRRVQSAQRNALGSPGTSSPMGFHTDSTTVQLQTLPLPVGKVTVEHLVPEETFRAIISEFLDRTFPVLPVIHLPEFVAKFEAREYETNPRFFRLCIALCAVTMATMPRQIEVYGCNMYRNSGELVERAAHLVLICRLSSNMAWQNTPSPEDVIVSIVLSTAAHYAEWNNVGWAYMSEATHSLRALELYKQDAYSTFDPVDTELCKRAFWLLYIMQVHDRLSFTTPHTSLSYDPLQTDWDFLLPSEVADEGLSRDQSTLSVPPSLNGTARPLISGFIALIKVFLCVAEVLSQDFPGQPLVHALSSGNFGRRWRPHTLLDATYRGKHPASRQAALLAVVRRLQSTLKDLPDELKISPRGSSPDSSISTDAKMSPLTAQQFAIMRVNIHVTSLYLQSTLLDICINDAQKPQRPPSREYPASIAESASPGTLFSAEGTEPTTQTELWELREQLARELLDVVSLSNTEALESNGLSMIVKIREIAASLLDTNGEQGALSGVEGRTQSYVTQFVDILAKLDYTSKIKHQSRM